MGQLAAAVVVGRLSLQLGCWEPMSLVLLSN